MKKKKVDVADMPRRPSLFWDVDPKTVDPQKHARYIIERILDFGLDKEVKWLWDVYPHELIRDVVDTSRVLHAKTVALWELLLPANQKRMNIRCPACGGSGFVPRQYFQQEIPRITREFLGLK